MFNSSFYVLHFSLTVSKQLEQKLNHRLLCKALLNFAHLLPEKAGRSGRDTVRSMFLSLGNFAYTMQASQCLLIVYIHLFVLFAFYVCFSSSIMFLFFCFFNIQAAIYIILSTLKERLMFQFWCLIFFICAPPDNHCSLILYIQYTCFLYILILFVWFC